MIKSLYEYPHYRSYLKALLQSLPGKGHGVRSQWAKAMGCQVAYVSHVLAGKYELSLEQGEALANHLGLSRDEKDFFLLRIQESRAGTHSLREHIRKQIQDLRRKRDELRNRMRIQESLTLEDQAIYYSSWHYSAIHMLLTIPEYRSSPEKIAEYFSVPILKVKEVLDFLLLRNLIRFSSGRYEVTNNYIFINKDSPLFTHQQSFWRHKAVESLYRNNPDHIHFASVFSLSESDVRQVREILLAAIEKSSAVIKPSKEERLYAICMDYFEVR